MSSPLPERSQYPAASDGQRALDENARHLLAAVEEALVVPTSYRDDSRSPAQGDSAPVPQPGRPPMSQGATDTSVLMLTGGITTVMVGGTAAGLMYVSQFANPVVCGLVFGAPTALVLAIARLAKRAKPEPEVHHHYNGNVDQRTVHTSTRGVWAKTNNKPT